MRREYIYRTLAIAGISVLSISSFMETYADIKNMRYGKSAYTEEEWAGLMDDTLKYSEIEDLVNNFNPSISQAWSGYSSNIDTIRFSIDELATARMNLRNLADMAKSSNDFVGNAMYTAQADAFTKIIDGMDKSAKSLAKPGISNRALRQGSLRMSYAVKNMLFGYKSMEISEAMLVGQRNLYDEMKKGSTAMYSLGMLTATDKLSAELSFKSAENSLAVLSASKDELKKSLIMMCGWKSDSIVNLELDYTPDLERIAAFNPETDISTAIGNNFQLIEFRGSSYKKSLGAKEARRITEEQMEASLLVKLREVYGEVQSKKADYEAAKLSKEAAGISQNILDTKLRQGMLSASEYQGEKLKIIQAEANFETAKLELKKASETYEYALEGGIEIE